MPGDRFIELALDKGRHVLDVLFMHASEAVTIQDRPGELIYANNRAAQMLGVANGDELIVHPTESLISQYELVDLDGKPVSPDELPGRRVLRGEPVAEQVVGYRHPDSGDTRWTRIRSSPVKDDSGRVVWAINFFNDITDEVVQERERELLSRARDSLAASIEVDEILIALARVVVPDLAYWAGVHIIDDGGYLTPVATVHPDSTDQQIVIDQTDQIRIPIDTPGLEPRVARSGGSEVVRFGPGASLEDELPDLAAAVQHYGLTHVVCAPLKAADRVVGTFTLGRRGEDPRFNSSEMRWIEAVAERAGVSLANALLYAHERETAEVLQRGLVPTELPEVPGMQIASRYRPQARFSGVGGDFFDVLVPDENTLLVAVGDIEGKGIPAAAAVGVARYTLRATAALDPDPDTVMAQMNNVLRHEQPARMCTLAYMTFRFDDAGIELGVVLAGHPPPLIVRADGGVEPLGEPCPPLGFLAELEPLQHRTRLGPGDTVVAYTDGFAIGAEAPPESLAPLLKGAHSEDLEPLLDRLLVQLQIEEPNPRDDVVLLALRVERPGE
ncbi:MAG TPA: SpoIIE family protein phosphatase [Acidimicrobiia bacterium]|nr:SpoIIE family protein phosphatase [Acidimicrobiia bacterium]